MGSRRLLDRGSAWNGLLEGMNQFANQFAAVCLALGVLLLAACGGGGGGGGVSSGPPANVAGVWTVTETGTSNNCGDAVDPPYPITIEQDGTSITVTTSSGTFSGKINGNTVSWSGNYPEQGGTTTITSLTATVSGSTFSGTSHWTWTNGSTSCSGTTNFHATLSQAPTTFTIGGTISGLSGTVVLQNNGGNNLSRAANGAFTFAGTVNSGSAYNVTVLTQPAGQTCSVANGSGNASSNVTNVTVTCSAQSFTLATAATGSGSVSRNPNQTSYAAGTQVQLTAVPQTGSTFSFWSGGLTGSQNPATVTMNSNLSITANFGNSLKTLTVLKASPTGGTGTVTGGSINCGTVCTESIGSGSVVLTATPANGSTFGGWTGCDTVSTNTCTVNMTSNKTVTVSFNLSVSAPTVSVPPTSSTGSYNVTVSCSGLCSTAVSLQEAPNTGFVNPTTTFYNVGTPLVVPYNGKAAGTYCYRASSPGTGWGSSACVTVNPPTTAVLRISNTSSYDLVDVRLNNVQQANYPNVILAGGSFDFTFSSAGTVNYALGNGFYNPDQSRNIWFTLTGSTTVTLGQTTTVTFANPTIGQLLTGFTPARNWDGNYFDANANSWFARFRFTSATNGWQLFGSTAPCFGGTTCTYSQQGSGTARLISWPKYSSIVTFDFGSGTTQADIAYPFGSFQYRNGPASWPIIEYVMQ